MNTSEHMQTNPDYIVDGCECESEDSCLAGDGQYPPFYVFSPRLQANVAGPFESRDQANEWIASNKRPEASMSENFETMCKAKGWTDADAKEAFHLWSDPEHDTDMWGFIWQAFAINE